MYSPRLHSSAFQRNHSITASSGSAVWQRISPELLHRFGCPLVSDQGLVTACHTPKGNQIRPQTAEKSAWWKWRAKWKKKGEYIGTPFQSCYFFAWSLQSNFSGTTAPIWMPFGVLEAGTKPWSDTKGHPNRCSGSREIAGECDVQILILKFQALYYNKFSWVVFFQVRQSKDGNIGVENERREKVLPSGAATQAWPQ